MSEPVDPLLSAEEIARLWRVDVEVVAELVADGNLPSLDGGAAARRGLVDVPCSRLSWAEALRVSSPGAVRRIDQPYGEYLHPAASVAMQLCDALVDGNIDAIWQLSSAESQAAGVSPTGLAARWHAALPEGVGDDVALTTGVYDLAPHPGVGVRLMRTKAPVTQRVDHPTPMRFVGLVPLIEIDDVWRAQLSLAELDVDWPSLLAFAPP